MHHLDQQMNKEQKIHPGSRIHGVVHTVVQISPLKISCSIYVHIAVVSTL